MNWKKLVLIIALLTISMGIKSEMTYIPHKVVCQTGDSTRKFAFHSKTPSKGIWEAMTHYGIPDSIQPIVYCQAKLESNLGKKTNKNNLFGLSSNGKLRSFNHWAESVKAYRKLIYAKYENGNFSDYYYFLMHIPPYNKPYAEDPNYIKKLKTLVNQLN